MRHECSNCKHFRCEVEDGMGRGLEPTGRCTRKDHPKMSVDADDYCNQYQVARWAKAEGDAQ